METTPQRTVTVSRIEEFKQTASRPIRTFFAEKNFGDRGVTNFLNTVKSAKGEYIALLDGDDYWTDPKKLQTQVDFLDAHPECALCVHRTMHVWNNGKTLLSPRPAKRNTVLDSRKLLYSNFASRVSTVVRRSSMEQGLPDWYPEVDVTSADWLFNLLVGRTGKIGYIDKVMAHHRLHADGLTMQSGLDKMLSDKIRNFDMLAQYLQKQDLAMLRAKVVLNTKLRLFRLNPNAYMAVKNLRYVFHRQSVSEIEK